MLSRRRNRSRSPKAKTQKGKKKGHNQDGEEGGKRGKKGRESEPEQPRKREKKKYNKTLRYLDLQNNIIGDSGATSLAKNLEGNMALLEVNLRDNPIGKPGRGSVAYLMAAGGHLSVVVHSLMGSVLSWEKKANQPEVPSLLDDDDW
jgi:hypothetical protein